MKRYRITMNSRTFDVQFLSDPLKDRVEVEVNGEAFTVEVSALPPETEETESASPPVMAVQDAAPRASVRSATPPDNTLTAPLPGVIKSVAVRAGQQVSPGDELLVIEAMKMDNVIRATREGIVQALHVTEGRQVAHGELMLEYRR
jgi:biotin carboxyl carrier protein